jgi:hypothetical protein
VGNYAPSNADDYCERSWSVRQSGQIPGSNVPLYLHPQPRLQGRQTLGNPCWAGRKAGPVALERVRGGERAGRSEPPAPRDVTTYGAVR